MTEEVRWEDIVQGWQQDPRMVGIAHSVASLARLVLSGEVDDGMLSDFKILVQVIDHLQKSELVFSGQHVLDCLTLASSHTGETPKQRRQAFEETLRKYKIRFLDGEEVHVVLPLLSSVSQLQKAVTAKKGRHFDLTYECKPLQSFQRIPYSAHHGVIQAVAQHDWEQTVSTWTTDTPQRAELVNFVNDLAPRPLRARTWGSDVAFGTLVQTIDRLIAAVPTRGAASSGSEEEVTEVLRVAVDSHGSSPASVLAALLEEFGS